MKPHILVTFPFSCPIKINHFQKSTPLEGYLAKLTGQRQQGIVDNLDKLREVKRQKYSRELFPSLMLLTAKKCDWLCSCPCRPLGGWADRHTDI